MSVSNSRSPQQELARRELARRRLLHFTKITHPKYKAGWVHDDICRRLERFSQQVAEEKSPRLMLLMPPRQGKQIADETPVPTPSGWTTHGQLKIGDLVFHPDGHAVKVVGVSGKTISDIRVTLSNDEQIFCHENHEWVLFSRAHRVWKTVNTKFLMSPPTRRGERLGGTRNSYQLPLVAALEYTGTEFTVHPYVLGAWLGDGSTGEPCITCAVSDIAIIDKVCSLGYPVSAVWVHSTTGVLTTSFAGPRPGCAGRLTKELQDLGVYNDKYIPAEYQRMTVALRLELLAGLIDTDGYTDMNGRVVFTAANRHLIDGVMELCEGLGFRPYVQEVQPRLSSSGIQGKKVYWTVGFQPTMSIPVSLLRKRNMRIASQRRVGIRAVERVGGSRQGHCIQVDSSDGLYVVGRKMTTTHNSELASIRFPAWHLGHHPDHEVINVGYNLDLPMIFSRKVREILREPDYSAIFPGTQLDPDSQGATAWKTVKGGGFTPAGVGGGITGKGAHILVVDDPIKNQEEADSILVRDNLESWFQSTAYTRLSPGGGVLIIETWWNDDDLAGRLQALARRDPTADQYEIVKYPALAEAYEFRNSETLEMRHEKEKPLIVAPWELMRSPGEALHPARYDADALVRIKANLSPRVWSALYQQNPVPDEGMYFKKEYFKYTTNPPDPVGCYIYTAWDWAVGTKTQNDWTVGATLLQDASDNLYVLEVLRFKGDTFIIAEAVVDVALRWGTIGGSTYTVGFEDGQIWKAIEPVVMKRFKERHVYPSYELLKPLTDKLARARPLQGRMQQGKVIFPEGMAWMKDVELELLRFPAGAHDDIVDALAWVAQLVVRKDPPKSFIPPPPISWRDKLSNSPSGSVSHMSA